MKLKIKSPLGKKKYKLRSAAIIIVFILGATAGILLAEAMLRKFIRFPLEKEYMKFLHLQNYSIPEHLFDRELFWITEPEFRGVQYSLKKKDGLLRIICLGDSTTQSYAQPGLPFPREQTYVYNLEELLKEYHNHNNVEVINAGVGGYSTLQGLRYLKEKLRKYRPDLIISWFGINDDSQALFFTDKEQRSPNRASGRNKCIFEHSALYLFLKNIIFAKKLKRVSADDYYKNCESMLVFGRENDFEMVFIVPFRLSAKTKKIEYLEDYKIKLYKLKDRYKCGVFDIGAHLSEYKNLEALFVDVAHPNAKGNKVIAQIIFKMLKEDFGKKFGNYL